MKKAPIGGKSLREHFEVTNHRDAIDYVERLAAGKEAVTAFHVRQIHKLVLTRINDELAGRIVNPFHVDKIRLPSRWN